MNTMTARSILALLASSFLPACATFDAPGLDAEDLGDTGDIGDTGVAESPLTGFPFSLGAHKDASTGSVAFRVYSSRATRIEVWLYKAALGQAEAARYTLSQNATTGVWSTTVTQSQLTGKGLTGTIYYGYRAWGPNFTYDATWTPGSLAGFKSDVNANGDRFNPNKLLLDPYAFEMSHDPTNPQHLDGTVYGTGASHRAKDTGLVAPKGVVIVPSLTGYGTKPTRPLKDEVIYEVHVRGLTKNDASVPSGARGTYAGAGYKAAYLKSIGVTAVELLPVHESPNETNDVTASTDGDNYWGYMTLNFFAPDRRYSSAKGPGGPTTEFKAMVKSFHDQGIKVYVDVVFNHTAEGGLWDGTGDVASLWSWRGLDNGAYYELAGDKRYYYDNTGCGSNLNVANEISRDMIIDSLWYWKEVLGIDGFRFDLASVLGNTCEVGCFNFDKFDPANALNRAVNELPVRPAGGGAGVDLIAEPWAIGGNSYQVGGFPAGWAEWNGSYRDTFRKDQNRMGVDSVTPGEMAARFAGSSDLYADDGRKPWHSVNFLVAHDGFTLRDLYAYNGKNNLQPWPYGPSDGGEDHNNSWDQGGSAAAQRKAARNGLALLMLSAGVPLITGGDEMYRTQYGNNNTYNVDSDKNWLNWGDQTSNANFYNFARRIMRFRGAHAALRPASFFKGTDNNGNGLKDITWYRANATETDSGYMTSASNHFLAYRIDSSEAGEAIRSIYVAYNGWSGVVTTTLPPPAAGKAWYRVGDTAPWMEGAGNFVEPGSEELLGGATYDLADRSLLILIEK